MTNLTELIFQWHVRDFMDNALHRCMYAHIYIYYICIYVHNMYICIYVHNMYICIYIWNTCFHCLESIYYDCNVEQTYIRVCYIQNCKLQVLYILYHCVYVWQSLSHQRVLWDECPREVYIYNILNAYRYVNGISSIFDLNHIHCAFLHL